MPPTRLTGQNGVEPRVAIGTSGDALLAWGHKGGDVGVGDAPVAISVRPPGGQFGPPGAISPAGALFVGLAANDAGDATVAYFANGTLGAVFRRGLGAFSAPADLPAKVSRIAIDGLGNTTFLSTVEERDDNGQHLSDRLYARTRAADGSLGPERQIARGPHVWGPSIAADALGNVTVAYRAGDSPFTMQVFASNAYRGGEFSVPHALSGPAYHDHGTETKVVTNSAGDTLVAWAAPAPDDTANPNPAYRGIVHSSFRVAGGAFGPEEVAPIADKSARGVYQWDLAMDGDGNVVAAWSTTSNAAGLAYRPTGGPWSNAKPGGGMEPTVSFDGKGTATVAYVTATVWNSGPLPPDRYKLWAVRRARGGSFGTPQQVAAARCIFEPDSAADAFGNVIVVWSHQKRSGTRGGCAEHAIDFAIWDANAPSVTGFGLDEDAPRFNYKLNEPATVTATVERLARRGSARLAKLRARSTRGAGTLAIQGKLVTQLEKNGSYRATIVARDSAGRSSKPRQLRFAELKDR